MAEKSTSFLTDSFEAVVTSFYNEMDDVSFSKNKLTDLSENFKFYGDLVNELNAKECKEKSVVNEVVEKLKNVPPVVDQKEHVPHVEEPKPIAGYNAKTPEHAIVHNSSCLEINTTTETNCLDQATCEKEVIPFLEQFSKMDEYSNKNVSEMKSDFKPFLNTKPTSVKKDETMLNYKPSRISALDKAFGLLTLSPEGQLPEKANADLNRPVIIESQSESSNEVIFRTKNTTHFINFEWSLESFSEYLQSVFGAEFSAMGCKKKWQPYILFKSIPSSQLEKMDVFIKRADDGTDPISLYFDLGIFNSEGDRLGQWDTTVIFTDSKRYHCCIQSTRPDGKCSNKSNTFSLPNDELIIKGCIKVQGCCVNTKKLEKPVLNISDDNKI